jgi:hypothetical protein
MEGGGLFDALSGNGELIANRAISPNGIYRRRKKEQGFAAQQTHAK